MGIPKNPRASTLIELLVVIAIIAILAAILVSEFTQAKDAAKKTADLANFRQIGAAIALYASDNDDRSMHVDHEAGYDWFVPLYPYVRSRDTVRTPAYRRSTVRDEEGDWVLPESDCSVNGPFAHGDSLSLSSKPSEQIVVALRGVDAAEPDDHP